MKFLIFVIAGMLQSASAFAFSSEFSSPWIQCKSLEGSPYTIRNYFYGAPTSVVTTGETQFTLTALQIVEPLSLTPPYLGSATATIESDTWNVTVKSGSPAAVSSWTYSIPASIGFDPELVAVHYQMVNAGTSELLEESRFEVQCSTSELLP